eukprot:8315067-Prorocentrum_lima.AAC.1
MQRPHGPGSRPYCVLTFQSGSAADLLVSTASQWIWTEPGPAGQRLPRTPSCEHRFIERM